MSQNIIDGNPTKKFFIEMITRDISIEDAIIDLLDNSIDGATQINPDDFSSFHINVIINEKSLEIEDNCGGFTFERAQRHAFRFGRPDGTPGIDNSVGRFGIGMKRALFKMGKLFSVESKTENERFRVEVNVDEWCKKKKEYLRPDGSSIEEEDWNFDCIKIDNLDIENGTIIKVTDLKEDVINMFCDDGFLNSLYNCITRMLCFSLSKGLTITLNGKRIERLSPDLLIAENNIPNYFEGDIGDVHYKIVAGLGLIGEPKLSGWYVFCNNRLVLEGDQTNLTGWGVNSIPKWHIDYVMFRGYVFLYSAETSNLPLTTTKKGLDASSITYRKILPHMRNSMIQVTTYLKAITGLKEEANDYRKSIISDSRKMTIEEILQYHPNETGEMQFLPPILDLQKIYQKRGTVRVAYDVAKTIADKAKCHADTSSYKELGLTTFYYYLKMEDIDD